MIEREIHDKWEKELEAAIAAGEDPEQAASRIFPRLFYTGHKVIHTYQHPDRRAKWECYSCKHQWIDEEGDRCPVCRDCKHGWKWVAEPYGPQDRKCMYCGITLEKSMGEKKFAEYIAREREEQAIDP